MAAEERRPEAEGEEIVYKTKIVQFLGRSTLIILQNENGPCPLLAICNALLLRNNINLSLDEPEVPQQKLMSLVADRLIGSNSNVQDKDVGYLINQQQNIADAIDLLPRLSTGIDVNVQFRKINDFEFTRECAIFDLLDIGLYHGWIVDPQDSETAAAIGTKSYNTLAGELVAFEAKKFEVESKEISDADAVDFVAATTAVLGVPSPSLSKGRAFDSCTDTLSSVQGVGKGDKEEAEVLLRVLNLSRDEVSCPDSDLVCVEAPSEDRATPISTSIPEVSSSSFTHENEVDSRTLDLLNRTAEQESRSSIYWKENELPTDIVSTSKDSSLSIGDVGSNPIQSTDDSDGCSSYKEGAYLSGEAIHSTPSDDISQPQTDTDDILGHHVSANVVDLDSQHLNFERKKLLDVPEIVSGMDISEPLYEGEDCILDSGLPLYEDREPVYEGEMALAEQTDDGREVACTIHSDDQVSERQCHLIKNFLESMASQLTIYGLFCLQEGLKERELSVFFRNNHFSTMFKFNGELFLLVTDQGYINQPDLVWEKLNEVNGDTVFMTGNFTEFKAENQVNDSWNEHNAIKNTTDYLAALEGSVPSNSSLNSDLQLAIALQQQEFEQPQNQQQQQPPPPPPPQRQPQQTSSGGRSRLVTGPQVPRSAAGLPQKGDSKHKERCSLM